MLFNRNMHSCLHEYYILNNTQHKCALCGDVKNHTPNSYGICIDCGYMNGDHTNWTELIGTSTSYKDGGYFYLTTNTTMNELFRVNSGKTLNIDLNGYELTQSNNSDKYLFECSYDNQVYNIYDSKGTGALSSKGYEKSENYFNFVKINKVSSIFNMYGGTFVTSNVGKLESLIYAYNGSKITLKNTKITNLNKPADSGSYGLIYIYSDNVNFNIVNCDFTSNTSIGAVIYSKSPVNVYYSRFTNNIATGTNYCSSVVYTEKNDATFIDCTFENNTSYMGTIRSFSQDLSNSLSLIVSGCKFNNNTGTFSGNGRSDYPGGAISANGINFVEIENTTFNNNKAGFAGGALTVHNGKSFIMNKATMTDNKAINNGDYYAAGGAIFIDNTNATFTDCSFNNNIATVTNQSYYSYGGAVYFYRYNLTMDSCTLKGNKADYGSAVYHSSGTAYFNNLSVTDNIANKYAAVYLWSGATIKDSTIANNKGSGVGQYWSLLLDGKVNITNNTYEYEGEEYQDNLYIAERSTLDLASTFSSDSKIGIGTGDSPDKFKTFYFASGETSFNPVSCFTLDYDGYLITSKNENNKYYVGKKGRIIENPSIDTNPAYNFNIDTTGYTSSEKSVNYQWYNIDIYNLEDEDESTSTYISDKSNYKNNKWVKEPNAKPENPIATITNLSEGDIIYITGIDYLGGFGSMKIFDSENNTVDQTSDNEYTFYVVDEPGTYTISGFSTRHEMGQNPENLGIKADSISVIKMGEAVKGQTYSYLVKGATENPSAGKSYICKASFMNDNEEDFWYYSDSVTVLDTSNIVSISVSEDSKAVAAPEDKAVPTVYIGEDKPEIKILTLTDTYQSEEDSFSAVAPIIIEQNRTFLGIRDMATVLGVAPEAIKWDDTTKTATITKSGATISVTQGSKDIKLTYKGYIYTIHNDVSAINKNDRIYLPFRVIFELFGYEVNWDSETRIITCK